MTIWKGTTTGPNKEEVDYANRKEGWGDASEKWERERADEAFDMQPNQPGITGAIKIKGVYKKPQNKEYYDSSHNEVAPRKPFGVGPLNRPITRSQTETPLINEVPFGPMLKHGDRRRKPQRYRINEPAVPDLLSKRDPNPLRIRPRKPTQAERSEIITAKLKQRIAQVRVGVAYRRKIGEVMKAFNEWKYNKNGEVTNPLFTKLKGGRRGVRFLGNTFQYSGHYTKSNTDLPLDKTDTKFTPHNIMRKTPKGMVIDNYGYDSESTWRYMNMAGISTQAKGSDFLVGGKKYNPEQGGKMLVPWANISDSPIPTKNRGRGSVRPHQREFERQTKLDYSNSPTGVPLDPTRIQPDDQQTINEILGTNRKGPKRVIRGVKAHHPIGYATGDVGKHSKRGVPLSNKSHFEAEHPEKTVIGYKGTQKYDFKNARLKIARIRQRNISRRVTQINMAKEDYDPVQAWATMIRDLKVKPAHQLAGNWTYLDGDLVDFDRPGSKQTLMKSVKGNPKQSIFTVSNTHGIKNLFDEKGVVNPELQKRYDQLSSLNVGKATIGKWEDEYDATVNFRDIDNKRAEEIARGAKGDIPQQAYIETFLNQETGEPESKFHSYNEKTDTYE